MVTGPEMGRTVACQDQRLRLQHIAAAEQAQSDSAQHKGGSWAGVTVCGAGCKALTQQARCGQRRVVLSVGGQAVHLLLGRLVLTTNCSAVSARKSVTSSTAGWKSSVIDTAQQCTDDSMPAVRNDLAQPAYGSTQYLRIRVFETVHRGASPCPPRPAGTRRSPAWWSE